MLNKLSNSFNIFYASPNSNYANEHLQEHIHNLNTIHVQNGASGYAKYALDFPLKDMIVCTDFQRRTCKYKDENGNIVSDPEMTKRLFSAIKERNEELINEYSAELPRFFQVKQIKHLNLRWKFYLKRGKQMRWQME